MKKEIKMGGFNANMLQVFLAPAKKLSKSVSFCIDNGVIKYTASKPSDPTGFVKYNETDFSKFTKLKFTEINTVLHFFLMDATILDKIIKVFNDSTNIDVTLQAEELPSGEFEVQGMKFKDQYQEIDLFLSLIEHGYVDPREADNYFDLDEEHAIIELTQNTLAHIRQHIALRTVGKKSAYITIKEEDNQLVIITDGTKLVLGEPIGLKNDLSINSMHIESMDKGKYSYVMQFGIKNTPNSELGYVKRCIAVPKFEKEEVSSRFKIAFALNVSVDEVVVGDDNFDASVTDITAQLGDYLDGTTD